MHSFGVLNDVRLPVLVFYYCSLFQPFKTQRKSYKTSIRVVDKTVGDIDVSDGCWRPNMLVTSLRCWWPIQNVGDRFRMLVTDLIY